MTLKRKPSDARERDLQLALARILRGRAHSANPRSLSPRWRVKLVFQPP